MADLRPFAAVMPPGECASRVADPPYDVVSMEEARQLVRDNPLGFMQVARAEVTLPEGVDPYADVVYEQARNNYRRLCREVPLTADSSPHYYIYSLRLGDHVQTGIVAAAAVDDYDADIIRKHERTRRDKEDDRTRHILTLRSQTGPVFLTYRDDDTIDALCAATMETDPLFSFQANDGVTHSGWRVPDHLTDAMREAFARIPHLYIADGHHRAASASRVRATLRRENPELPDDAACHGFLAVTFPAGQLRILPYNRLVKDWNGLSAAEVLTAIEATPFALSQEGSPAPAGPGCISMALEGKWYQLSWKGDLENLGPVDRLDVSLLQDHILGPILGIDDPRTSKRIDFVGGIRGTDELLRRIEQGEAALAFSMFPTTVEQLMAISDAGQIMPPKSTWFEPKLRDGLFVHDI